MSKETKAQVDIEEFDKLDIRLGQIINVVPEPSTKQKTYKIQVDVGKFGKRFTVGRFTQHTVEQLLNKKVMGLLNVKPIQMGDVESEFLLLGVQYPEADSGEASILSPLADAKIGGKLF